MCIRDRVAGIATAHLGVQGQAGRHVLRPGQGNEVFQGHLASSLFAGVLGQAYHLLGHNFVLFLQYMNAVHFPGISTNDVLGKGPAGGRPAGAAIVPREPVSYTHLEVSSGIPPFCAGCTRKGA